MAYLFCTTPKYGIYKLHDELKYIYILDVASYHSLFAVIDQTQIIGGITLFVLRIFNELLISFAFISSCIRLCLEICNE